MNTKLLFGSLIVAITLASSLFIYPGSIDSIIMRAIIGIVAMLLFFLSINWDGGPKAHAKAVIVFAVIIVAGSIAKYFADIAFKSNAIMTVIGMAMIAVLILVYIKFIEPKVLNKLK